MRPKSNSKAPRRQDAESPGILTVTAKAPSRRDAKDVSPAEMNHFRKGQNLHALARLPWRLCDLASWRFRLSRE